MFVFLSITLYQITCLFLLNKIVPVIFFTNTIYNTTEFMKSLSVAIMENYKNLVDNYNLQLEKEKEVGLLLTPEQIVNMNKKKDNAFNI